MNIYKTDKVIPFDYIVSSGTLGNLGQSQVTLTFAADSSFELHAFLALSSLDLATDFRPNNFTVQITDQATGRQFSNGQIPQRLIAGDMFTALREGRLIVFPPLAVLQFTFVNLSASNNVAQVVLKGYKLIAAT